MTTRKSLVAGRFYPESKDLILKMVEKAREESVTIVKENDRTLLGGISPHAGYMFCLKHMIPLFELLSKPENGKRPFIIINPNHSGMGASLSIDSHDYWETPMGKVEIDSVISQELLSHHRGKIEIVREPLAQEREHSAEVLLPLLSYYWKDYSFLPISMGRVSVESARQLAEEILRIKKKRGLSPLILASSDFNHFSTPKQGRLLDDTALEPLMNFDSKGFYKVIKDYNISICGYGPIMVLLEYAKLISTDPQITLLSRGHSGEADIYGKLKPEEVVDYISLAVYG